MHRGMIWTSLREWIELMRVGGANVKSILFGGALALCLATAAHAAGGDTSEKLFLPLEGARTAAIIKPPTNDQMQREYPRVALAMSLAGETTMTCHIEPDGRLDECRVDSESPEGLGFGAAGLRLAAYFSAKPATLDGHPVSSLVTIPIRFKLDGGSPPPPSTPIPPPTSPAALPVARDILALDDDAARLKAAGATYISQLTTQAVVGGDAARGERIADAYRQGLDDAVAEEIDQRARIMAATMTADQLRATLAYLKTPAGAAFRRSLALIDAPKRSDVWRRATEAAKAHFCDPGGCPGAAVTAPGS